MERRRLLQALAALGLLGPSSTLTLARQAAKTAQSVEALSALTGELTVYLGRGEGGLYEKVLSAIRERNPELDLGVRRGSAAALANTIVAEANAGVQRADVFWSIDSGSLGVVAEQGAASAVPEAVSGFIREPFRYPQWAAISGRVRTVPYNTERVAASAVPDAVMDFPDTDLNIGWAPSYGSFQSFITAMRLLEGEQRTREWLRAMKPRAKRYAGELGVVIGVARGEVDAGFANHYYTLRYRRGKPDAPVALGFTRGDAGSLVNVAGAMPIADNPRVGDFLQYLLTKEVQGFLAREAFEVPMVPGVQGPDELPSLADIEPPDLDLRRLGELQPTLTLLRDEGIL